MSAITAPIRRPHAAPHFAPPRVDAPRLRAVEDVRRRHGTAYAVLIVAVLGAAVFGVVALNAMAAANAVEARSLEAEVAVGERAYGQLVATVAELEDPARIREQAMELGLQPAEAHRFLAVERRVPADGLRRAHVGASTLADPLRTVRASDDT